MKYFSYFRPDNNQEVFPSTSETDQSLMIPQNVAGYYYKLEVEAEYAVFKPDGTIISPSNPLYSRSATLIIDMWWDSSDVKFIAYNYNFVPPSEKAVLIARWAWNLTDDSYSQRHLAFRLLEMHSKYPVDLLISANKAANGTYSFFNLRVGNNNDWPGGQPAQDDYSNEPIRYIPNPKYPSEGVSAQELDAAVTEAVSKDLAEEILATPSMTEYLDQKVQENIDEVLDERTVDKFTSI